MRVFKNARGPDTGLRAYKSHYVRVTRWGDVVQKWPRPQPVRASPYDVIRRAEWSYAGYWTTWANPLEYQTAQFLSKGTDLLPRDILMQAMYGSLYILTDQDGFTYPRLRDLAQNPQLILDQITTQTGAILYRSAMGWVHLPPGNNGQVLAVFNQTPEWQDVYPVAVETAQLLAKETVAGLTGLRVVDDSTSVAASWSSPGHVSFQRAALTGDVTAAANSNATTLASESVSYAKIQKVAGAKKLLTGGATTSQDVAETSVSSALDWLATTAQGDVLYRSSTGWLPLAAGASGKYLKTNGSSADPSWDTPSAGLTGGGTPYSPYFNNTDIHLCIPTVSSSALTGFTAVAGTIYFQPITVPFQRTFTKFAVSVNVGGNIAGSNVRLAVYSQSTTTGGPDTVILDAGNLSLASAGYQSLTVSQALSPGPYYFAAWFSAANGLRGSQPGSTLATIGWNLSAGTPSPIAMLSRAAAFGGSFGTESGNTHSLYGNTGVVPLIGMR